MSPPKRPSSSPKNNPLSKLVNHASIQLRYNHGIRSYLGYIGILAGVAGLVFQLKGHVDSSSGSISFPTRGRSDRSYIRSIPTSQISSLLDDRERNSYRPPTDPKLDTVDCFQLLSSYRNKDIPQMERDTYHKSAVRLTKTNRAFYISTHDKEVDHLRESVFLYGSYYEGAMTAGFESILNEATETTDATGTTGTPSGKKRTKRKIVVDVGGNIGWFSLLSAANDAEVYTFEPNIVNMVRFCESLVLNHWAISLDHPEVNRVHPYMKGVSNVHGAEHAMYVVDSSNPGTFTFDEAKEGKHEALEGGTLPLVTLDALAKDQGWIGKNGPSIAILKIDVEGLEWLVLQGAKQFLGTGRVENIFMEFKPTQSQEELNDILGLLYEFGYGVYKIGAEKGPDMEKKYDSVGPLIGDIIGKVYGNDHANVWFRRKGGRSSRLRK